jgi:hypothetical protein
LAFQVGQKTSEIFKHGTTSRIRLE